MKIIKYMAIGIVSLGIGVLGYMEIANKNTNELGLSIFSWIKKMKGKNVQLDDIDTSKSRIINHMEWTYLLSKHVSLNGSVDYRGLAKNKAHLVAYLNTLSNNPPAEDWSKNEKIAYWINAYNAFTVKLIVDHYPLKSIKEISDGLPMINSPWDIKFFKIGGVDFDLNTIEHEILRKQFDEPRIHFAINCASFSCPKLRHEAYFPKYLEYQLNDQAQSFINNEDKNQISSSELKLSGIFNWFRGDFTRHESLYSFLKRYNSDVNEENDIAYLDYNWGLNE